MHDSSDNHSAAHALASPALSRGAEVPAGPAKVFTLVCHRDIDLTCKCFGSFLRHCKDPVDLAMVSDGSLTAEDVTRLRDALPSVTLIDRKTLDDAILPLLADFPLARKYREWCPWALKLLDIPLLAEDHFVYIDSDILFLRDFKGLANGSKLGFDIISMHCYASIYSFTFHSTLRFAHQLPLVQRLNAGFLFARKRVLNLDLVERFLRSAENHESPALWEQTAWAMLSAQVPSGHFQPQQIAFPHEAMSDNRKLHWDPVAIHFVGGTRHLMPEIEASQGAASENAAPIELAAEKTIRLTRLGMAIDLIRHRLLVRRCRRAGILK